MKKYWYYGVRTQQLCVGTTGRPRYTQVVRWHDEVYGTADAAANAAGKKMATHPGLSYFVQGFERQLEIIDGECKGFKTAQ